MKVATPHISRLKEIIKGDIDNGDDYCGCSDFPCGVECTFIKLDKEIGAKVFHRKRSRDIAFKNQKKGFKSRVGPKAIASFTIREKELNIYGRYVYLTKIAKKKSVHNFWDRVEVLAKRLKKIGLSDADLHSDNVAFIGNRMVCIDFGPLSQPREGNGGANES